MKHTKKIITKLVDEMLTHCYALGAKRLEVLLNDDEKAHYITIKSDFAIEHLEKVESLHERLNRGRSKEMEEMYWTLAGMSDLEDEAEILLVSSLIDEAYVSIENNIVTIFLTRYRN